MELLDLTGNHLEEGGVGAMLQLLQPSGAGELEAAAAAAAAKAEERSGADSAGGGVGGQGAARGKVQQPGRVGGQSLVEPVGASVASSGGVSIGSRLLMPKRLLLGESGAGIMGASHLAGVCMWGGGGEGDVCACVH